MKILLASSLLFLFSACSHHHKGEEHHHHDKKASCDKCSSHSTSTDKYGKKCAHSVLEGKSHVLGKDEYKFDHGGQTYYFSSKEKMVKFKANLEENMRNADKKWNKGW